MRGLIVVKRVHDSHFPWGLVDERDDRCVAKYVDETWASAVALFMNMARIGKADRKQEVV